MSTVLSLHSDQMSFELHDDASAAIIDRSTDRQWSMGPVVYQEDGPIDVGHVWLRTGRSICEQYPGRFRVAKERDHLRVSVIGQLGETRGTFACSFKLDGPWLVFTLLEIDESLPSLIFPPAINAASLVLPIGVGAWYRKPIASRRIVRFYSGLNMRWFGGLAEGDDHGYIAVLEQNHADCALSLTQTHCSPVYLRSLNSWAQQSFPRVVRYRFTQGGYVGLAKAFRQFAIESGIHRPLRDKVEACPNLSRLIGGRELNCYLGDSVTPERLEDRLEPVPDELRRLGRRVNVKLTCAEVAKVTDEALSLGMEKGIAMLRGWIRGGYDESHPDVWPPEAAFGSMQDYLKVTARQGAVLGGLHDNYGDMYSHAPSFPRGTLRLPDGSSKRGGYWEGGQCYLLNPRAGLEYARRNWENISTLGIAKIYSDTITAMYLDESFEPGNTLTRSQDLHHKQELLSFFKSRGLVVASEEGADFGIPWLDTADTQHRRDCTGESVSVPLWPLVFHDAVLSGRHNTTVADVGGTAPWYLPNLLWGYYTMWWVDRNRWRDGFAETLFVDKWVGEVATDEMTAHRFLTPDLSVEQTEFASGRSAIVNYGKEPQHVAGHEVPAGGYVLL